MIATKANTTGQIVVYLSIIRVQRVTRDSLPANSLLIAFSSAGINR